MHRITTRPETADDVAAVRAVHGAAFPTPLEADIVDALRADPHAWIPPLSIVGLVDDRIVGHSLLTRCHVGDSPALVLGPCGVLPAWQGRGVGAATIVAGIASARTLGEGLIVVLGHPGYYPRFGFRPASTMGIGVDFDVPDDALMALTLDDRPAPRGVVRYPSAFGV